MNIPRNHVELLMELGYTAPGAQFLYAVATLIFDREIQSLETEPDKTKFFCQDLGITKTFLQADIYKDGFGGCPSARYFVDKYRPLLVTPFPALPPVVTFSYLDPGPKTMSGSLKHLAADASLCRQLDSFRFRYVSPRDTEYDGAQTRPERAVFFETHLVAQHRPISMKQAARGERGMKTTHHPVVHHSVHPCGERKFRGVRRMRFSRQSILGAGKTQHWAGATPVFVLLSRPNSR